MKGTTPTLSMSVTTSSCVAMAPKNPLMMPVDEEAAKPPEMPTAKQKKTRPTPIVALQRQQERAPKFSTGITFISSTRLDARNNNNTSLSLSRQPLVLQQKARPPPPRLPPTFLAPILISEQNFSVEEAVTMESILMPSNGNETRLTKVQTELKTVATLMAMDMCRVVLSQSRALIKCAVHKRRRRRRRRGLLYTPSHLTPPRHLVRGIPNYGQTCFLNSVLQSLASLPSFVAYLQHLSDDDRNSLTTTLLQMLESLQYNSSTTLVDPRKILQAVSKEHKQFRGGRRLEQQDAQELLQALVGMIISKADLEYSGSVSIGEEHLSLSTFLSRMAKESQEGENESTSNGGGKPDDFGHIIKTMSNGGSEEKKQEDFDDAATHKEHSSEKKAQQEAAELKSPSPLSSDAVSEASNTDKVEDTKRMNGDHVKANEMPLPNGHSVSTVPLQESPPSPSKDKNVRQDENTPTLSPSTLLMLETLSPITPSPLTGWLGSTLQCCKCLHVRPIQNAPFLDIPIVPTSVLSFQSKQSPQSKFPACTLAQCLEQFTSVERVQDVECRNCTIQQELEQLDDEIFMLHGAIDTIKSRTNGASKVEGLQHELSQAQSRLAYLKSLDPDDEGEIIKDDLGLEKKLPPIRRGEAKKCLLLTRLPNVLCLHVQRRYYDPMTDRMAKTMQHVDFPQVLDLSPYCAYSGGNDLSSSFAGSGSSSFAGSSCSTLQTANKKPSPKLYKLAAVIEHRGNAFGGHYQTYRRVSTGNGVPDQWVFISDECVTPIGWRDVQNCQAYMLFYESI